MCNNKVCKRESYLIIVTGKYSLTESFRNRGILTTISQTEMKEKKRRRSEKNPWNLIQREIKGFNSNCFKRRATSSIHYSKRISFEGKYREGTKLSEEKTPQIMSRGRETEFTVTNISKQSYPAPFSRFMANWNVDLGEYQAKLAGNLGRPVYIPRRSVPSSQFCQETDTPEGWSLTATHTTRIGRCIYVAIPSRTRAEFLKTLT